MGLSNLKTFSPDIPVSEVVYFEPRQRFSECTRFPSAFSLVESPLFLFPVAFPQVACVSPSNTNCEHTLNTLRYADRVKEHQQSGGTPRPNPPPLSVSPVEVSPERGTHIQESAPALSGAPRPLPAAPLQSQPSARGLGIAYPSSGSSAPLPQRPISSGAALLGGTPGKPTGRAHATSPYGEHSAVSPSDNDVYARPVSAPVSALLQQQGQSHSPASTKSQRQSEAPLRGASGLPRFAPSGPGPSAVVGVPPGPGAGNGLGTNPPARPKQERAGLGRAESVRDYDQKIEVRVFRDRASDSITEIVVVELQL